MNWYICFCCPFSNGRGRLSNEPGDDIKSKDESVMSVTTWLRQISKGGEGDEEE
jgi:hypothetical protein